MNGIILQSLLKTELKRALRDVKNARQHNKYAEMLGIREHDSDELAALKLESSKLQTKALKAFASSPRQKEILAERDKLQQRIKEMEEKEKRLRGSN